MPARQRRVGLQELGLPYAADRRRHAPPRAVPVAPGGRRAGVAADPPRPERARLPDARALQRRRDEGRRAPRPRRRGAERLAGAGRLRAARRASRPRRAGPGSRGRARRGLLRPGAARTRHPHPQRRVAHATTSASRARCRPSRACRRRSRRCASCRSAWRKGPAPSIATARVRADRRRAGGVPVPELARSRKSDPRRRDDRGLGRRSRRAEPARRDAADGRARGRRRSR